MSALHERTRRGTPVAGRGDGGVVLDSVSKSFGHETVVDNISLTVRPGEFLSLLGTSGCGKSTTLRMIAGFETPTHGRILMSGRDVSHVPPARRDTNMVFQSYALFPHLTVAQNVRFGLRYERLSRAEAEAATVEILASVRLSALADRRPNELSGGQQQRVALARALVKKPAALLLDEPLGALDLQLRRQLQAEFRALHRTTQTTFIYVTHDQEEAMAMSDRIAVMREGRIQQVGTPRELYETPANSFVAGFIGLTNLLTGEARSADDGLHLELGSGDRVALEGAADGHVEVAVRPECIHITAPGKPASARESSVLGSVVDSVYHGASTTVVVELRSGTRLTVYAPAGEPVPAIGDVVGLTWPSALSYLVPPGDGR